MASRGLVIDRARINTLRSDNLCIAASGNTSRLRNLGWWHAVSVVVAEKVHTSSLTLGTLHGLNPLAPTGALPDGLDEAKSTVLGIGTVVATHNRLDGLASLIGVIEGNQADVVVENVSLDDTVHEVTADETKFAIDRGSGTADIVPGTRLIVRKGRIGVLEESDGNWRAC